MSGNKIFLIGAFSDNEIGAALPSDYETVLYETPFDLPLDETPAIAISLYHFVDLTRFLDAAAARRWAEEAVFIIPENDADIGARVPPKRVVFFSETPDNAALKRGIREAVCRHRLIAENREAKRLLEIHDQAQAKLNAELEHRNEEERAALARSKAESQEAVRRLAIILSETLEAYSEGLRGHGRRVAQMARSLAIALRLPDNRVETLELAGYLHDIGLFSAPREILRGPESALTREERKIFRRHPITGSKMLKDIPGFDIIANGVLYHHENLDGTGYPEELKGQEIPLEARVLRVVDMFDRLMFPGLAIVRSRDEVAANIAKAAGKTLDPDIVRVFMGSAFAMTKSFDEEEIEMPVSMLEPGMELTSDIVNVNNIILLKRGTPLNDKQIARLSINEGFDPLLSRARVSRQSVIAHSAGRAATAIGSLELSEEVPAELEKKSYLTLVVDDEPGVVEALKRELIMEDYEVIGFTRPLEVVPFLRSGGHQRPLAVISDLTMPGLAGDKLAEEIHREWPDLPVIIVTAHATRDNILKLSKSAIIRVLIKPWDKYELLKMLDSFKTPQG